MTDAKILEDVVDEADQLIRRRLNELGIEAAYLLVGVTPDKAILLRGFIISIAGCNYR